MRARCEALSVIGAGANLPRLEDRRKLDRWEASLPRCVGDVLKELNRTRYEHDARGNLARRVEPDGTTWLYRYDAANRLIEAQRFAKPPQADELERMEPIDGGGWRFCRGERAACAEGEGPA